MESFLPIILLFIVFFLLYKMEERISEWAKDDEPPQKKVKVVHSTSTESTSTPIELPVESDKITSSKQISSLPLDTCRVTSVVFPGGIVPPVKEKPISVQVGRAFKKAGIHLGDHFITSDILPLVSLLITVYLLR